MKKIIVLQEGNKSMKKIIVLQGLPASGKSTYAKELVDNNPGVYKRVNKDELRLMLDNNHWTGHNEGFIRQVRDFIIVKALQDGKSVIVDDTNFNQKHLDRFHQLAKENNTYVEIKFVDVSVEECIKRDLLRPNSVGEKVIRDMYNKYLKPEKAKVTYLFDPSLYDCIICDLDGTLAKFDNKNPYDRDFENDTLNFSVWYSIYSIISYSRNNLLKLIIVSGRSDKFREVTEKWLKYKGVDYSELYMRKEGDNRKDIVVKEEIFNDHIKGKYNPIMVFDDRLQTCRLWYSLGLNLFRVGNPDDDF